MLGFWINTCVAVDSVYFLLFTFSFCMCIVLAPVRSLTTCIRLFLLLLLTSTACNYLSFVQYNFNIKLNMSRYHTNCDFKFRLILNMIMIVVVVLLTIYCDYALQRHTTSEYLNFRPTRSKWNDTETYLLFEVQYLKIVYISSKKFKFLVIPNKKYYKGATHTRTHTH